MDSKLRRLNIDRSAFDIIVYKKDGDSFRQVNRLEWPEIARTIYSIDLINSNFATYSKAQYCPVKMWVDLMKRRIDAGFRRIAKRIDLISNRKMAFNKISMLAS